MAGSYSNPRFTILRNFSYLFQSGCIILHSHYQRECSSLSISLPYYCLTFENHHPRECDVVSHCGLICIPLMTKARESSGIPLQYSCMENPMDGGAWWAAVHGVARSWTRPNDFTFTFPFHTLEKEMATHSSVLAWRIPGMAEPGGLPSMGSHRVRHD